MERGDRAAELHPSGLLNVLDVAERAGLDTETTLRERGLSRHALQRGEWVSWEDYRTTVERISERMGGEDAFCAYAQELVEVAENDFLALTRLPLPHLTLLEFLNTTLGPRVMRCASFTSSRDGAALTLEMRLKPGHEGSRTSFRFLATAAESLATHLPLTVTDVRVDARGFSYTVSARGAPGPHERSEDALRGSVSAWLALVEDHGSVRRQTAALRAAEAVAVAIAAGTSALEAAEVIADGLVAALGARGVDIRLCPPEPGALFRASGAPIGRAHHRALTSRGRTLGSVTVYADGRATAEIYAALDIVGSWIAETLERLAPAGADSTRESGPPAAVPGLGFPVLEIDLGGRLRPLDAQAALLVSDRDTHDSILREARILRPPEASRFEVLPQRRDGRLERLLLIDRRARAALRRRISSIAREQQLTPRQSDIVELLAFGLSNPAIASSLAISTNTVENQLTRVLRRCGLASRHALIARVLGAETEDPAHE